MTVACNDDVRTLNQLSSSTLRSSNGQSSTLSRGPYDVTTQRVKNQGESHRKRRSFVGVGNEKGRPVNSSGRAETSAHHRSSRHFRPDHLANLLLRRRLHKTGRRLVVGHNKKRHKYNAYYTRLMIVFLFGVIANQRQSFWRTTKKSTPRFI